MDKTIAPFGPSPGSSIPIQLGLH